jgi:hypothetical protein
VTLGNKNAQLVRLIVFCQEGGASFKSLAGVGQPSAAYLKAALQGLQWIGARCGCFISTVESICLSKHAARRIRLTRAAQLIEAMDVAGRRALLIKQGC